MRKSERITEDSVKAWIGKRNSGKSIDQQEVVAIYSKKWYIFRYIWYRCVLYKIVINM